MTRPDLGLGRLVERDDRDQDYRMRSVLPATAFVGRRYWWDNGSWNDQNGYGTCVGHNTVNWIEDSPVTHPDESFDPFDIYRACCAVDEWDENDDGDVDFGTSVHAAAKVMQARGILGTYRWAMTFDEVRNWLGLNGPLLVGTTFYPSMFATEQRRDATGEMREFMVVDTNDPPVGGHCYLWNGINTERQTIRVKMGSWRRDLWGVEGRASLSWADARTLIEDDGEIMSAAEVRR